MQPWDGIGAKLGAVFLALESETLRADSLILPLVCPNEDEAAVGETRHRGRSQGLDLPRADLNFRARQRVLVEGPKLHVRSAAARFFGPSDGEP